MDMETKFFSWSVTGEDHVTVIARGRIDVGGVKRIFLNVAEITQMLVGCGVLIDLRQGMMPRIRKAFTTSAMFA